MQMNVYMQPRISLLLLFNYVIILYLGYFMAAGSIGAGLDMKAPDGKKSFLNAHAI